jgi:hypothetical protein
MAGLLQRLCDTVRFGGIFPHVAEENARDRLSFNTSLLKVDSARNEVRFIRN